MRRPDLTRSALDELDRRAFLKSTVAVAALGSAGLGTLSSPALADEPKKGGALRLAMGHGSTTDSLDPHTLENGHQIVTVFALTNTLTELDTDGKLAPSIAESWESSPDAKAWTFRVRKGVEFHNGRTLTAEDVAATINYHRKEGAKTVVKQIVAPITDVKVDDKQTVTIVLSEGSADFPFNLSVECFGIYPAASDGLLDWGSKAGCGGYVLKEFEPGVRARLERFPNYWRSDRAHVAEAEVLSIHDTAARANALQTGEVDAIDGVDARLAEVLGSRGEMIVEETSGPLHYDFPMRVDTAPFNDNNVRLALKYAVDREATLKTILRGRGQIGNDSPIGPSYRFHARDLEQRGYDPDKAKFHLKQAGLSELTLDLSAADAAFTGAVDACLLFKEQAKAAGITINVIREPNDGYWSEVWNKKPWCASYWAGYPTEDFMLTAGYYSKSEYNATKWQNERFDALLLAARAELDEAKRLEMYTEMQSLIRDVGGVLVPCFANDILARNKKVAHGKLSNQRGFDGRKIVERWWMV